MRRLFGTKRPVFQAGQRWTYRTRVEDAGSTVIIGRVGEPGLRTVHVTVDDVRADPRSAWPTKIGHLPLLESALDESVIALVDEHVSPGPAFEAGYTEWRAAGGGIFTTPLSDAVEGIVAALRDHARPWDFDAIVHRMRTTRTSDDVEALYDRLFRLRGWYFIKDPHHPEQPVVFPKGPNGLRCVLAFTEERRAFAWAEQAGVHPRDGVHVMGLPVDAALESMLSLPDVSWACFNPPTNDFPLHLDTARERLDAVRARKR